MTIHDVIYAQQKQGPIKVYDKAKVLEVIKRCSEDDSWVMTEEECVLAITVLRELQDLDISVDELRVIERLNRKPVMVNSEEDK